MFDSVTTTINKTDKKLLTLIAGCGGLDVPQNYITETVNLSRMGVHKSLKKLESNDLIDIKKKGKQNFIDLNKSSFPFIFSDSPHEIKGGHGLLEVYNATSLHKQNEGVDEGQPSGLFRVHGVQVSFSFKDQYGLKKKKERFIKREVYNWKYFDSSDMYVGYKDSNEVRVLSNKVQFYLNDVVGYDLGYLKRNIFSQVIELREWFEKKSGITLESDWNCFEVIVDKQHIALIGEPFGRFIDEETSFSLSNFTVKDPDSEVVYYEWDKSKGIVEIESKNYNFSEELIDRSKKFWLSFAHEDFVVDDLVDISEIKKVVSKLVDDYKDIFDMYNTISSKIKRFDNHKRVDKVGEVSKKDKEKRWDFKYYCNAKTWDSDVVDDVRNDLFGF